MEQPTLIIQGQPADSAPEAIIAQALEILDIYFIYQFEVFGGTSVRGGQVIDFLLLLPPRPIPLFLHGRYWHSGEHAGEDQLKMQELAARTAGEYSEPVIIWDDEFNTVDDVIGILRARIL